MKGLLLAGVPALLLATPATAQMQGMDHPMHEMSMPGMHMSSKPALKKAQPGPARKKVPARPRPAARKPANPHAGHPMASSVPPSIDHAGHNMPGMDIGGNAQADHDMGAMPGMQTEGGARAQAPHAAHNMSSMPGMSMGDSHAGHDMGGLPMAAEPKAGTDLPAGNAPAPASQPGLAAARFWGAEPMMEANHHLRHHHGGETYYQVLLNVAEHQARSGRDGYRWDGEAWVGGDLNRFTLKSEGEGSFGRPLESAEVQALYSRALDPYWNLQAGARQDFGRGPSRSYATVGVEGLAPYWFETEAALFLSDHGNVLGRVETWYDQRITQSVVLQPRVEANFSAQDVRATGTGSGLVDLEIGLRLRYEKSRRLAPYVGVSWERQFGDTARFTRARGDDTGGFSFVAGVRTWF